MLPAVDSNLYDLAMQCGRNAGRFNLRTRGELVRVPSYVTAERMSGFSKRLRF